MSISNRKPGDKKEAPAEPLKRSIAGTMKAIARKPDLEVACPVEADGLPGVLLLGSWSAARRTRGVLVTLDGDRPDVRAADLAPLYGAVAQRLGVPVDQLNLEGASRAGDVLREVGGRPVDPLLGPAPLLVGTADTAEFVRRYRAEWIPLVGDRWSVPPEPPMASSEVYSPSALVLKTGAPKEVWKP